MLAGTLASLDRAELSAMLRFRVLGQPDRIADLFDLAEALVKPESIRRALAESSSTELAALLSPGEAEGAVAHGLAFRVDAHTEVLPEVRIQLEEMLAERGLSLTDLGDLGRMSGAEHTKTSSVSGVQAVSDTASLEHAFECVRVTSHLVRLIAEEPVRVRNASALSAGSTQRLLGATGTTPEALTAALELLTARGVIARVADELHVSASFVAWRGWSRAQRFVELTSGWLRNLRQDLRLAFQAEEHTLTDYALTDHTLTEGYAALYPLASPRQRDAFQETLNVASFAGLALNGRLTALGERIVAGESTSTVADLAQRFPSSVSSFYVQPDLSIIAPGPLDLDVEERLLGLAVLESAGLASSYRVSAQTLAAALDAGQSAEDIREFLVQHSLTGIPQPLEYLLDESVRRHRSIIVHRDSASGRTLVTIAEQNLRPQLLVDRALKPLGLDEVDDDTLSSRADASVVTKLLREAGYPASLEGALPKTGPHDPQSDAQAQAQPEAQSDPVEALVERILSSSTSGDSAAAFDRLVQYAIRHKQRLRVALRQPDGTERTFVLRPVGLSNGRLRGIDEAAEVERTLPMEQLFDVAQV